MLLVARGEPGRFDPILSAADVERLLCETAIRAPALRLVKDGAQLPLREYTEDIPWRPGAFSGTALVDRVAAEFAAGATLVLQALHLHWRPAALYCRGLEMELRCPAQANAYFTPARAQGFSVHHDTHDVFVLQVAGRKRWRVYRPVVDLPLKDQKWSTELGDPGAPVADVVLEAGDTLYLPRGWPHEAFTSDEQSLHLTVGLHPATRLDALRAALDRCAGDVEFRRSVDLDGALPDDLLARLAAHLRPDEVARWLRRRLAAGRRPILDDQLAQVRALEGLTAEDAVERRPTVIAVFEHGDDRGTSLLFEGKEISFTPRAAQALAAVVAADGPFTAAQLPGPLDEAGRLVLVRRLVREGFLRVLAT
jgi:hypothetical protein